MLDARKQAQAKAAQLLAAAETAAADDTAQIHTQALADADRLRSQAEGRLEEAASLIVRKVVDA